jgi:zinc transport system ATP-binding protein
MTRQEIAMRQPRDSRCQGCQQQREAAGEPLLICRGLLIGYGGRALLPPIDAQICRGELWAVVGRNGAGKTTFFRTLLGLQRPLGGEILHRVAPLALGYIPQRSQLDPLVPLRGRDVVAMGVERGGSYLRPLLSRRERRQVAEAIDEMGAQELAGLPFGELSEGQKQRVLMARLVAGHPALAVLDEPTAAMDEVAERETLELIQKLQQDHGMAVMIVSHHLPVVGRFADRVIFVDRDAQSVVAGTAAEVFAHPAFRARYGVESSGEAYARG